MLHQKMLLVFLLFNLVLGQDPRVEYVNVGQEDLLVTLLHQQLSILLAPGETHAITRFSNYYAEDAWANVAKCQNQTCTYPRTRTGLVMQPITDNVNDTLSNYVFVPGGYNRAFTIESLDNPDCIVASCEIDLELDCPEDLQMKDDDGVVVACDIKDVEMYIKFCPNCAQILADGTWGWFSCQGSRMFRVSIK